jgi:DNA-binding NarL/FixJ family response regulator
MSIIEWSVPTDLVAEPARPSGSPGEEESTGLVERDAQLAALRSQFEQCLAGTGSAVLVTGAVATGKTELMYAFAEEAKAAGALFLNAAGSSAERALPLGVIRQLFEPTMMAQEGLERLNARLSNDSGALARSAPNASASFGRPVGEFRLAEVLHNVSVMLLELAQERPVMIGVDDVHFADSLSLHCLLYLVRRMRSARLLLVLNEVASPQPANPMFRAELMRQPHCCHLSLAVLSAHGVGSMLSSQLGAARAEQLAVACHAATGGNPLLVRALRHDQRGNTDARSGPAAQLTFGAAFDEAVVAYLYRSDPEQLAVARSLAVLGKPASPALLGRLVGVDPAAAERVVGALGAGGLLDSGWFRHPRARAAVRDSVSPDKRSELHRMAAGLLHEDGASATVVADHLLAADVFDFPWATSVLYLAAEQALGDGDVEFAVECLKRAMQCCADDRERAAVRLLLVRGEWREDPSSADRHLVELAEAVRNGDLTGRGALMLVRFLLWCGRSDEASDVMDRLAGSVAEFDEEAVAEFGFTKLCMAVLCPGQRREDALASWPDPDPHLPTVVANTHTLAASLLAGLLKRRADDRTVTSAEQILQRSVLDDRTIAPIAVAITALVHADEFQKAATWCDRLLAYAADRRAPSWQAILSALRAEISFCKGDLDGAVEHGRAAFDYMSPQSWGVVIGMPLAVTLLATTAVGNFEEAGRLLDQPVPDAMFQNAFGLLYLRARGRYYLATNRVQAALNDFRACGSLMKRWGPDLPSFVPWRSDAALAYLFMGDPRKARDLIKDQLRLLGDGRSRSRAIALRILAATSDLKCRHALLAEAVDILQSCGDQLELAQTLADLGSVQRGLGEAQRARTTVRRAWQMANECHAETLSHALLQVLRSSDARTEHPVAPADPASPGSDAVVLSDAESRVAALVVKGFTNREIARKLFITVSTVEQHLTRTYRKLNVNRRADLATRLPARFVSDPVDPPVNPAPRPRQPHMRDASDDDALSGAGRRARSVL